MLTINRNHREKRDHIRMRVDTPVSVAVGSDEHDGFCHDISAKGFFITMDQPLPENAQVTVKVISEFEQKVKMTALAEVIRVTPSEKTEAFDMGMQILEVIS